MRLSKQIWVQFTIFIVVSVIAIAVVTLGYIRLPSLFGIGRYTVTVELTDAAGLYDRANVTYRGVEVGRVTAVNLTDAGVKAVLSLDSGTKIPADLDAQVHSQTAVGEQYVALLPRSDAGPMLSNGDVVARQRASVPPDINSLLDATNRSLQAIPGDNLKTVVDEAHLAFGGLGPELSRIVKGSTKLTIDARKDLDALTALIDRSKPVLDSQTDSADAVQRWAAQLATITDQLRHTDSDVRGVLQQGGPAADEVRALIDRLQPGLPVVLANLLSVGDVAVTYRDNIEQLLVMLPQVVGNFQGILVANRNTKQDYRGAYISFNLNLNVPPPCTTGFLPTQQQRAPAHEDYPERPAGNLYCRVPQDSPFNVRGARNTPCVTVPGKRAPTWQMCESDENYVPLNEGYNWKGDPNATLSGQDVPELPSLETSSSPGAEATPSEPPPITAAEYDPAIDAYVGPDGHVYTQATLARTADEEQTWQQMLIPPTGD